MNKENKKFYEEIINSWKNQEEKEKIVLEKINSSKKSLLNKLIEKREIKIRLTFEPKLTWKNEKNDLNFFEKKFNFKLKINYKKNNWTYKTKNFIKKRLYKKLENFIKTFENFFYEISNLNQETLTIIMEEDEIFTLKLEKNKNIKLEIDSESKHFKNDIIWIIWQKYQKNETENNPNNIIENYIDNKNNLREAEEALIYTKKIFNILEEKRNIIDKYKNMETLIEENFLYNDLLKIQKYFNSYDNIYLNNNKQKILENIRYLINMLTNKDEEILSMTLEQYKKDFEIEKINIKKFLITLLELEIETNRQNIEINNILANFNHTKTYTNNKKYYEKIENYENQFENKEIENIKKKIILILDLINSYKEVNFNILFKEKNISTDEIEDIFDFLSTNREKLNKNNLWMIIEIFDFILTNILISSFSDFEKNISLEYLDWKDFSFSQININDFRKKLNKVFKK